jgi:hypothetical protein
LADISHLIQDIPEEDTAWYEQLPLHIRQQLESIMGSAKEWAIKVLQNLNVHKFSGVCVEQISNTSFLFSRDGTSVPAGEMHRDSHSEEYFVLVCLSKNVPCLQFCNPSTFDFANFNTMNFLIGDCEDTQDVIRVRSTEHFSAYQNLLLPLNVLKESLQPVVANSEQWTVGSVALVRGDVIHRSPAYVGYRNHGFFTISAPESTNRYIAAEQYTAVSVLIEILKCAVKQRVSEPSQLALARALAQTLVTYRKQKPWNRFPFPNLSSQLQSIAESACVSEKNIAELLTIVSNN